MPCRADDGAGGSARQQCNVAQSIAATDEEEDDDFEVEEPLPLDDPDGSDQNESDEDGGGGADGAGLDARLAAARLSAGGGDEAMAGDDDE